MADAPWSEIATAGVAAGVTQLFNWLAGRRKNEMQAQAYAQGAVDHAVKTAFGGMETAVDGLKGEVGRLSLRVAECDVKHQDCEQNLREVRVDLDQTKRLHRAEIDRLMAGPIAGASDRPPEDPS